MKSKVQIVRFDQIQFMDKYLSGIPTLFLHEACMPFPWFTKKLKSKCSGSGPFVVHYFSEWFRRASVQNKLVSDMTLFFVALFIPSPKHMSGEYSAPMQLLNASLECSELHVCNLPSIPVKSSFFKSIRVPEDVRLKLKKAHNVLQPMDEFLNEWLNRQTISLKQVNKYPVQSDFVIIYCDLSNQVKEIKQLLMSNHLTGVIFCLEETQEAQEKNINVMHVKYKAFGQVYRCLKEIQSQIKTVSIFFYWDHGKASMLKQSKYCGQMHITSTGRCFEALDSLAKAIQKKCNVPKILCDFAKIGHVHVNASELDFNSEQAFALSIIRLPKLNSIPLGAPLTMQDGCFAMNCLVQAIYDSYFWNVLQHEIFIAMPIKKLEKTPGLATLNQKDSPIDAIVEAMFLEIIIQTKDVLFKQFVNYEHIKSDLI